ncbi:nucleolar transcription factor 1-like, partial [Oxyura jamaicensis]|uniref:nucleolar transcription factor 1-like n=1 Tax=Oxyura jamaicensis TaxID=8884 RepID=UPI0015A5AE85
MNGEAECPADLEMTAPKNQDRWSQEDMLTLLECMKNNLPSNDGSKFKTTESHLDWEKVAFKDFSGEMCKMKWMEISNEVRKFRTLTELIMDAEEHVKNPYKGKKLKKHPDFPKKPLTPYFRFFMEKRAKYAKLHPEMSNLDLTKILSKKYKELPEKKKMKYIQDFQREKQEFERNLARFREDHPDLIQNAKKSDVPEKPKTPQQLWYNHEKKIYLKVRPDATTKEVKESLGKQWSQLSDKKRLKWIHKALEQRKEYEEIMRDYIQKHPELNLSEEGITRSTLTKAERQLKDKFDGRPTKPPPNSYSLYCAELMANMKDVPSTERMVLCSQQWKLLSQKEKDAYHKKCDQKKKDYEIELLRFLESLPEEEQQRVLGEEKMLGSNRKGATSPASKKSSPETGKASSEKPKRPISAMFIFSEEKRKQLQEERPELSESELTRLLARMWNDLSEKKKVGGAPPAPSWGPHLSPSCHQGFGLAPPKPGGLSPRSVTVPARCRVPRAVPAPCSLTDQNPAALEGVLEPQSKGWKLGGGGPEMSEHGGGGCRGGAGEGRPVLSWCLVGFVSPQSRDFAPCNG